MNYKNNPEISVSALTQKLTKLIRDGIGEVRVLGEISGYKAASSGHRYFTLKDMKSQIDCLLWRSKQIATRKILTASHLKAFFQLTFAFHNFAAI